MKGVAPESQTILYLLNSRKVKAEKHFLGHLIQPFIPSLSGGGRAPGQGGWPSWLSSRAPHTPQRSPSQTCTYAWSPSQVQVPSHWPPRPQSAFLSDSECQVSSQPSLSGSAFSGLFLSGLVSMVRAPVMYGVPVPPAI